MQKKILLVDDDPHIREIFYVLFSRRGYKVFAAASAREGIELINQADPDLVLMDIKMPQMDGIQALKKIRETDTAVKVIMLTAINEMDVEMDARMSGASGFLRKDLSLDIIAEVVDEILKKGPDPDKDDKSKILIVDDEPRIREVLVRFLTKEGFQTITAASGQEALDKVVEEKPIVVLCDIKMPGMDGMAVLKKIREINDRLSVIMITAVGDEDIARQVMELGAYDCIVKPLDLVYLEMCLISKIILSRTENV